jgi:phage-related protein
MSRNLHPSLLSHANQLADELPWIWLYEFQLPTDPLTRYRLTNYTEAVYHGTSSSGTPLEYSPAPIVHSALRQSSSGDLPSFTVSVGYAGLEVQAQLVEHGGMVGQPAVVRLVNLESLGDPTSSVRWDATIRKAKVDQTKVSFELGRFDLQGARVPARRYISASCSHVWLSTECGYVEVPGATNTVGGGYDRTVQCPRTLEACQARGEDEEARGVTVLHPLRWGGHRGIPGR